MPSRKAKAAGAVAGVLSVAAATVIAVVSSAPVAAAATNTFTPVADTYVDNSSTGTNYGTSGQLGVDNSPVKRIFLRFTVSGLTAPVTGARLRLHTDDVSGSNSPAGGTLKAVSSTTWSETGTTWANQPAVDGATLGTLGAVSRNAWYEVDVTSAVTGNGTVSIAVTSTNSDGADYDSRESGAATAPQLVITSDTPTTTTQPTTTPTTTQPTADPVLVGAGDIADSGSGDTATANLLDGIPGTVFTTGDNVYTNGTTAEFNSYYNPTWGRHKARTKPSPGNHDYNTSGATGYYSYFGAQAGPSGRGYYSYDLGNWHVVSLNSEITKSAGSPQEQWLRADLAANTKPCTLAYWHKPRFTSGSNHAPDTTAGPLVQALYDYNAEVIVTGHNHQYERFAPMNPSGAADGARGIRHFVAGMGGAGFYSFGTIAANSEARNNNTHGVLKFTLHANSYDWQFVPEAGKTYADSGTNACH
ncbi:DNRLRE domain-containing protein [Actinokineospora sp. NBRC 105648]|uniref:CBM96 family carbohydrate-binding protein n=1 Tax=Actinokineospora sp. NBRC 105648 TaxID=3032206 RepID=UPI0024A234AB|nr:DNRLRE domain-containing protein [Actinokineospora sp. NBRC 105648]GLZ38986.1 alkaline phosphatase [Actinokineospora sp. NBRC 105648]